MKPDDYDKILSSNITQKYKIAEPSVTQEIDNEFGKLASELNIQERIDNTAQKPAFVTLKDHNDNFRNRIQKPG